jgi:hypothetical protein
MTLLRPDRPDQHDSDAAELLAMAVRFRKAGTLCVAGGYEDQPALWFDAMRVVGDVLDRLDTDAAARRQREAESKARAR